MKIIISHDVDHLYASDHILKDLFLPKFWVRSFIQLCQKKITINTFFYRLTVLFHNRMNRIEEVMEFDKEHNIPSVFFFGMANVLGMSYSQEKARPYISAVLAKGFDAGVHGVEYIDEKNILNEHNAFRNLSDMSLFGIRTHYVRFDDNTFKKMSNAGYMFDSTWFNKEKLEIKAPYKVGNMWEFPLHIMDGYICMPGKLNLGLKNTFSAIKKAEELGVPYCTILYHDYQFDDRFDPEMKNWYVKTVEFLEKNGYEFISYRDAIKELENKNA